MCASVVQHREMFICCAYIGWSIVPFAVLVRTILYRPVVHLMFNGTDFDCRIIQVNPFTAPETIVEEIITEAFPEAIHGSPFVVREKSTSLGAWYPTLAAKGM